jgi:hypothetical protein
MRYLSLVLAALLSLFILPGAVSSGPPIRVANVTSQCINGVPTITVTLTPLSVGGFYPQLYYHNPPSSSGMLWPGLTNPATFNVPPGPGNLEITSLQNGGIPSGVYPYSGVTCGGLTKGMTWLHTKSNAQTGTITVGCSGCDAGHGDTPCSQQLPVLCIYKPPTPFPLPKGVNNSDQYNLWSGGVVATTQPHVGMNSTVATAYCQAQFDPGWRVAEFHDGWGWNFQAYGGTVSAPTVPSTRFWVYINDQSGANCP